MLLLEERKKVVEYCRMLQTKNLTRGTGGNISIYDRKNGLIAVSPSGVEYSVMKPEDVVIVDIDGNVVEGEMIPSSETGLHIAAYKANPTFNSVVHTHSAYATMAACMGKDVPAVHYLIGFGGSDHIPCIPYYTYGSLELAAAAGRKYEEEQDIKVILLGNHGLLAGEESVEKAFAAADEIEFLCQIYVNLLQTGQMNILSQDDMKVVVKKFATYGQRK